MKLNDLVQYQDSRWIVRHMGDQEATLQDNQGKNVVVQVASPDCVVVANPPEEWPFLIVRDHPKGKRITAITRTVNKARVWLTPYVDWVPSEPTRPGGSIFFSPALGLLPAETLLINWAAAHATSVQVPTHFGTLADKAAKAAIADKPKDANIYDRLLEDRFGDDE